MFQATRIIAAGKSELYAELALQAEHLLAGERDRIANAANFAALVWQHLPAINWCGFYFFDGRELVVGPFQGKPACIRIALGRGVCGTAASTRATHARLAAQADLVVVEGVGGWLAPLADDLLADALPRTLDLPVILVVGLRLGCLNHALLSARAIVADGARLLGWIANPVDPEMALAAENLATLRALLPAPCLGVLARDPDPSTQVAALAAAVAALRVHSPSPRRDPHTPCRR